jgi:hypothetical protein
MIFADAKTAVAQAATALQTAVAAAAPPPPIPTTIPTTAAAPLPAAIFVPAAPVRPPAVAASDFLAEHKQELLIGGGVLLAGAIGYAVYKKTRH